MAKNKFKTFLIALAMGLAMALIAGIIIGCSSALVENLGLNKSLESQLNTCYALIFPYVIGFSFVCTISNICGDRGYFGILSLIFWILNLLIMYVMAFSMTFMSLHILSQSYNFNFWLKLIVLIPTALLPASGILTALWYKDIGEGSGYDEYSHMLFKPILVIIISIVTLVLLSLTNQLWLLYLVSIGGWLVGIILTISMRIRYGSATK